MNKKIKILISFLTSIVVIITVITFTFSYKQKNKITKTIDGVVISKETGEVIDYVIVSINGEINKGKDTWTFQGEFIIDNIEYTKKDNALLAYSVGYGDDGWDSRGILIHSAYIWKEGKLRPHHAITRWVEMDLDFSYLVLANYEEDGINGDGEDTELNYNGTDIMVFPAYDSASALKILEEYKVNKDIFTITSFVDNELIDIQ